MPNCFATCRRETPPGTSRRINAQSSSEIIHPICRRDWARGFNRALTGMYKNMSRAPVAPVFRLRARGVASVSERVGMLQGMQAPRVVSLFSGCGGLDLGFAELGFDIAFASDHDPAAIRAYRHNVGAEAHVLDVLDASFPEVVESLGACDVLLGGFPCQGFSKAGPKQIGDERNHLYRAMITALTALRPLVFVAENVDGLAQNYNGSMLDLIVRDCAAVGYEVEWRVIDAAWFGAPQHRRRIVIVGRRLDFAEKVPFSWPVATHRWISRNGERAYHAQYPAWASDLLPTATLRSALRSLDVASDHDPQQESSPKGRAIMNQIGAGQKLCNARHDTTSVRTWDIPLAFGTTSAREREILEVIVRNRRHKKYGLIPNGNPLSLEVLRSLYRPDLNEAELDALVERKYLKRAADKWDVAGAMFASGIYKRPLLSQPSPTVLTVFGNPRYFLHPTENRGFTPREAARIQTFPDSFEFGAAGVAEKDAFRLIGNAVPPLVSRKLAASVLDMLGLLTRKAAA